MRGRYVVLEGGEGVGKTTQAAALRDRLVDHGVPAEIVREPGGDPFAEAGRDLLLGDLPRTPETEVLAFNALRAQLLVAVVRPLLEGGTWVLADRGRLSTIAYQGHGGGADLAWTRSVCELTVALCPPDLELVLDVGADEAARRRRHRGVDDRFERMDQDFHDRVNDAYRREAEAAGVAVIDSGGELATVTDVLWSHLQRLL